MNGTHPFNWDFMINSGSGTYLEESALNVNLEEFMKSRKFYFLVLVLTLLTGSLLANGDMFALLAKDNSLISEQDSISGSFNDPFDYFDFIMKMSDEGTTVVDYLQYLPQNLRYKNNNQGYGMVYYNDANNLLADTGKYEQDTCQKFYCHGDDKWYGYEHVSPEADNGIILNAGYYWTLNNTEFDPLNIGYSSNTEVKTILAHAQEEAADRVGTNPFTMDDNLLPSVTYSFIHDGKLSSEFRNAIISILNYNHGAWWNFHSFNQAGTTTSNVTDSELLFHYIMRSVVASNGDVELAMSLAFSTNVLGYDMRELVFSADQEANGSYTNVLNFVLSDGDHLYLFRNSPAEDLRHDLSYRDYGEFYGVKTLDPVGGTQVNQYDLVTLFRDRDPQKINVFNYIKQPEYHISGSRFGRSMAIEGEFAAIGAPLDDQVGYSEVTVYKRSLDRMWESFQVINPHLNHQSFGYYISMRGNYLAIGAPEFSLYDNNGSLEIYKCGAIFVYEYSNNEWVFRQRVVGAWDERIGSRFELNFDGDLVIGIPRYDIPGGATDVGKVSVYSLVQSTWEHQYSWVGSEAGEKLGSDVDISDNGIIIAGSPYRDLYNTDSGAVSFFKVDNSSSLYNVGPSGLVAYEHYGINVDIDEALNVFPMGTFLGHEFVYLGQIGDPPVKGCVVANDPSNSDDNRVYVNCSQVLSPLESGRNFGSDINIFGTTIIVGDGGDGFISKIHVYNFDSFVPEYIRSYNTLYSLTNTQEFFGQRISYDGSWIAVGAPGLADGAAYFFEYQYGSTGAGRPSVETPEVPEAKSSLVVKGNYPNPFNPETVIEYSLTEESDVSVTVYNLKGQKVTTLVDEKQFSGDHEVVWNGKNSDGENVSSGVYFYKINTSKETKINKMVLMK